MVKKQDIGLGLAITAAAGVLTYWYIKKRSSVSSGNLTVTFNVVNPYGDPIDDASVNFAGQVQSTNFLGQASFLGIAAGPYTATVSAQNYALTTQDIVVSVSTTSFQAVLDCGLASSSCPCESPLDQTLCQCSPLIPAAILTDSIVSLSLGWQVNVCCYLIGSSLTNIAALGENPGACPGVENTSNSPSTTFTLTGTVADSGGNPICNQNVLVSGIQAQTQPFNTGGVEGYFDLSYPSSVTTGSDGSFELPVTMTLVVTGWNCYWAAVPSTPNVSGITNVSFVVNYRVAGTIVEGYTTANIGALICGDFFLC